MQESAEGEGKMKSRYEWILDNTTIRIVMNLAGFALWFAALYGTMAAAARV
jgi:hypothetical protein